MKYSVMFSARARSDLVRISDYIAGQSSGDRAAKYISRIERSIANLASFPERGGQRDDIRLGIRMLGFERRVAIAFEIFADSVVILRILYGGRDLGRVGMTGATIRR